MQIVFWMSRLPPAPMAILLTIIGLVFDWLAFTVYPEVWEGDQFHIETFGVVVVTFMIGIIMQGFSLWYLRRIHLFNPEITTPIWLAGIIILTLMIPVIQGRSHQWSPVVWGLITVGSACFIIASYLISQTKTNA